MKRDMDLVRLILLKVEEQYVSTAIYNLEIEGYDMATVAYHCQIMHDANLLSSYHAGYADGDIYIFTVGGLTWGGNDYLDKVRDNSIWKKTKDAITGKGLPLVFETIKMVSSAIITAAAEGVTNSLLKNGGFIDAD